MLFTGKIRDLLTFVHGGISKSDLTSKTLKFLRNHQHESSKKSAFTTFRNTGTQWIAWRNSLGEKSLNLKYIENNCSTSMKINGYNPLHTWSNVRNFSLPSIVNLNCTFKGC